MATWPEAVPFVPRLLLQRAPDAPQRWSTEATMVLVDISGFTSLSEQLARRGRVGAEDLVSTLTRIFTLLLSASDDGGDVVKFAGDAMLVMYDGPEHELHAVHGAAAIQRLLNVVGVVHLVGARARLRMSVGIHTGDYDFLLTGSDHQNLVVCGPDLDAVLSLQDAALPGQILISSATADALPDWARRTPHEHGFELGRVPTVPSVGNTAHLGRAPDLAAFLPAAFSARPDLLVADSDHRRCAVGFVQVTGLDRLLDAPDVLDRIAAITATVEKACQDNGVTLLDTDMSRDGFRYFLTAGAPTSLEDPEGRLLRALVSITDRDEPDDGFQVRAGAAGGEVFAGAVGAPFRRTYSVMGDTTNLAARLTSKAPAGEVLAHVPLVARSRTAFATDQHPEIEVKGKKQRLAVTVVTGVTGQRARSDVEAPYVGREAELATVRAVLAWAAQGEGGVVEVVGEPGLGKSRLAREATRTAGLRVVRVVADPYGAQVPHRTLVQLLRPLLGLDELAADAEVRERVTTLVAAARPELSPWLPILAPALGIDLPSTTVVDELDERFRPARFHDALRDLLDVLVVEPTVLIFEDAQWVDSTSAEALTAVLGELDRRPWAVLLTRRDVPGGLRAVEGRDTTVRPAPLSDQVARQLVTARQPLKRSALAAVVARAGGNPLFLLELTDASSGSAELPDSIEELVGLRIDELGASERELLRHAAVLGSRFPAALLVETTGAHDFLELVTGAGLAAFLGVGTDGAVSFHRELQREVAYGQLTFRRRTDMHRRAARAIERDPELAGDARLPLLSLHTYAAGDWAPAHRYSREAAHAARDTQAGDEAVTFCRRAVEAGRRSGVPADELGDLLVLMADLLTLGGHHEESVRTYGKARRQTSDPAELADIAAKVGMVHREQGRSRPALASARTVRTLARDLPLPRREEHLAEADLLEAGVRFWQGRSPDCRRLSVTAAEHAELLPPGTTRTRLLARAYSLHDTAVIELDGKAGTYGDRALEMFADIGDLYNQGRFSTNMAVGEYYEGRWDRAVEMYRLSLDIAERIGDVFSVAVAQMNIGELLALQGEPDEAVQVLRASVAGLQALDTPLAAAHAAIYLAMALRVQGDLDGATAELATADQLFEKAGRGAGFSLDELATRRLEVLVEQGDLSGAEALAHALGDRQSPALAPLHRIRVDRTTALTALARGDHESARAAAELSVAAAREQRQGYETAMSLLVLELVDPTDPAPRAEATELLGALDVVHLDRVAPRLPGS